MRITVLFVIRKRNSLIWLTRNLPWCHHTRLTSQKNIFWTMHNCTRCSQLTFTRIIFRYKVRLRLRNHCSILLEHSVQMHRRIIVENSYLMESDCLASPETQCIKSPKKLRREPIISKPQQLLDYLVAFVSSLYCLISVNLLISFYLFWLADILSCTWAAKSVIKVHF